MNGIASKRSYNVENLKNCECAHTSQFYVFELDVSAYRNNQRDLNKQYMRAMLLHDKKNCARILTDRQTEIDESFFCLGMVLYGNLP